MGYILCSYLYLNKAHNSTILNNTIVIRGVSAWGIAFDMSNYVNVTSNNVTTYGNTDANIYIHGSSYSNIVSNYVSQLANSTGSDYTVAIYADQSGSVASSYNFVAYNTVRTAAKTQGWAITFYSTSPQMNYNTIYANNITSVAATYGTGIYLLRASNSNVSLNIINNSGSPYGQGIVIATSSNSNVIDSNRITIDNSVTYMT